MAIPHPSDLSDSAPSFEPLGSEIETLTYQSRAIHSPSSRELQALLKQAQARNRQAGVTGMLLFNGTYFFQWLEGPKERLAEIWGSICKDRRHDEITVLNQESARHRLFSDWDMRLVSPDETFEPVCRQSTSRRPLPPGLIALSARLALEGDLKRLREGLEEILTMGIDPVAVYSGLIEPAAQLLGDWWRQDLCNEREIALALCSMRSVVREVAEPRLPLPVLGDKPLQILLIPPPEETHMIGVALAGDLYRQAGWDVQVEFPKSGEGVVQLVKSQWLDVLTISMSDVFTRLDRINALASAIGAARRASLNPGIVIVVGGRAFGDSPDLVKSVGADVAYTSLADLVQTTRSGVDANYAPRTIN